MTNNTPGTKRTFRISFEVTATEEKRLSDAAFHSSLSRGAFIRNAAMQRATGVLKMCPANHDD